MASPTKPFPTRKAPPTTAADPARKPLVGAAGLELPPPTREEFEQLAAQVRRLAAQVAHGRA